MIKSTMRISVGRFMVIMLGAALLAHPAKAQAPDTVPPLSLSLVDCIKLTLKNNLLLQQRLLDPRIKAGEISKEKAQFDPNLVLSGGKDFSRKLTPTVLAGAAEAENENLNLNIGIEDKLITGGSLSLNFDNARNESNYAWQTINPYYESIVSLKLVQPLLKDFGISVNEAQIDIAVNNHRISISELQQEMISVLSQSQKLYWDLVFNMENLRVKELLLAQSEDLLLRNKAKAEAGILTEVDVLEARSQVAARQEEVVIAQDGLKDAEDELKRITNLMADPLGQALTIIPTERPILRAQAVDMRQAIVLALANRPEYVRAKTEFENSRINLKLAKNKVLPKLDMNGSIGFSGLGKDYNTNWDKLSTADYEIWGVGASLTIPLGNRWARNNRIQRRLEQEQATLRLKEIEQDIILEVRQALRQLRTDLKRVDSTRIAQELEQEKLKIEEQKYELGMTTSHDLLEDQAQLAQASIRQLQAIIDYNKSLVDFEKVKGTTLKKHNINLKELQL